MGYGLYGVMARVTQHTATMFTLYKFTLYLTPYSNMGVKFHWGNYLL